MDRRRDGGALSERDTEVKRIILLSALLATLAAPVLADDHVVIEHATVIGAGVLTTATPAFVAGEATQKVVVVPATTGAKGSQMPITVPGLCPGQRDVISVRSSNTGSASAGSGSANITLGQSDEVGLPAQLDAIANAQLAAGPTINVIAALRDCSKSMPIAPAAAAPAAGG